MLHTVANVGARLAAILVPPWPPLLDVPYVPPGEGHLRRRRAGHGARLLGVAGAHDEIAKELREPELHGIRGIAAGRVRRAAGLVAHRLRGRHRHTCASTWRKGRPLIVAWNDGPRAASTTWSWSASTTSRRQVVVHDPARGPVPPRGRPTTFRPERWAGAGHWTLLVMPAPMIALLALLLAAAGAPGARDLRRAPRRRAIAERPRGRLESEAQRRSTARSHSTRRVRRPGSSAGDCASSRSDTKMRSRISTGPLRTATTPTSATCWRAHSCSPGARTPLSTWNRWAARGTVEIARLRHAPEPGPPRAGRRRRAAPRRR